MVFTKESKLKSHRRNVHQGHVTHNNLQIPRVAGLFPWFCPWCADEYEETTKFSKHLAAVHTDIGGACLPLSGHCIC